MTAVTRVATQSDISPWLELVPEAETIFGPMPTFETDLRRGIERGTALAAADEGGILAGPC